MTSAPSESKHAQPGFAGRHKGLLWCVALGVLILWIHVESVQADYARSDAAMYLEHAVSGGFNADKDPFTFQGRPLLLHVLPAAFARAGNVEGLAMVRALGIAGLLAFAALLWRIMGAFEWKPPQRLAAILLISASPAAVVWCGWSVCFAYPWAAALALLSGWGAWLTFDAQAVSMHRTIAAGLCSCIGLAAVLCIYQPAAGVFLLPVALSLTLRSKQSRRAILQCFVVFGITHLSYAVWYISMRSAVDVSHPMLARSEVQLQPFGSLFTYLFTVLPESLLLWIPAFADGYWLNIGGLLFGIVLTVLWIRDRSDLTARQHGWSITVGLLCVLGAGIPVIAAAEGEFYYRTLFSLYALLAVFCVSAASALLPGANRDTTGWVLTAVAIVFGGQALIASRIALREGLIKPAAADYSMLRNALLRFEWDEAPNAILLVWPPDARSFDAGVARRLDREFGSGVVQLGWVNELLARLILRNDMRLSAPESVTDVITIEASVPSLSQFAVQILVPPPPVPTRASLREYVASSETVMTDPTLGDYTHLGHNGHGWVMSSWLGPINLKHWSGEGEGYIYHLNLGWVWVRKAHDGAINAFIEPIGWFWTSPIHYPATYRAVDQQRWTIFSNGYGPTLIWKDTEAVISIAPHSLSTTAPPEDKS